MGFDKWECLKVLNSNIAFGVKMKTTAIRVTEVAGKENAIFKNSLPQE